MSFDKTEYQLTLFLRQSPTAGDAYQGNGSVQKNHMLSLKICISLNVLELTDSRKNLQ